MSLMDYADTLMDKEVIQVLKDAKDLLEKGWCKNHYTLGPTDNPTHFCSSGAIRYASRNKSFYVRQAALRTFRQFLTENTAGKYNNIPWWNDMHGRNKAQVIGMFERCVQAMESRLGSTDQKTSQSLTED